MGSGWRQFGKRRARNPHSDALRLAIRGFLAALFFFSILFVTAMLVTAYLGTTKVTVTSEYVEKSRLGVWKTRLQRDRVYGMMTTLRLPLERQAFSVVLLRERDSSGEGFGPRIKLHSRYWPVLEMERVAKIVDVPVNRNETTVAEFE